MSFSFPKLIGVIHLGALPGALKVNRKNPREIVKKVLETAVFESLLLQKSGFQALILENFGDAPFYKDHVPSETISAMTVIGRGSKVSKNSNWN